jgi:hypothetical protein
MNLVNPFWAAPPPPSTHYLIEDFNGPALNSDWDGSGGTFTFGSGHIDLAAGSIVSVRNDLDILNTICTIHVTPGATGSWFLVIGHLVASTYLIEVRYTPGASVIRLTQNFGGVDHHADWNYGALSDAEWIQLGVNPNNNHFELYGSTDGVTFTLRAQQTIDGSFDTSNCGVYIVYISGTVQLESFDSIILA